MTNQTKNYRTDGGDTLVIGGKLVVEDGATVEGLDGGGGGEVAWGDVTGKPDFGDLAEKDTVVNADIAPSAAIALNKLANVAAGTDGLSAGSIQATLQALATRIQSLEDAAG